ncbi:hypothetical protein F5879DRAFT_995374 [Lentinula edodes]|nr:hypothetical protein F5879DRAFT_995374 [Lentinula edodes]
MPKRFGNVEATSYVELHTASPLPPPTLKDVHPQAQSPGTYPPRRIPSRELTHSRPISIYDLFDPILTFKRVQLLLRNTTRSHTST